MPVCLARHRSTVVEKLRFEADLEYVAFLVNSLPVFISITGLQWNSVIADTATWKPLRASGNGMIERSVVSHRNSLPGKATPNKLPSPHN
jgi:hypothetical protein